MTWRFWTRDKRRAHKSPPLVVVLGQRDELRTKVRHLENELKAVTEGCNAAWRQVDYLRSRVASLENMHAYRVPAPMERRPYVAPPPYTPKHRPMPPASPNRGPVVIPLSEAFGGLRHGRS